MAMAPKKMRGGGMVKKMELGGAVGGAGAGAGAGTGTLLKGAGAAGAVAGKRAPVAGKRAPAAGKGLGAGKELAPPALQPKRPSQPKRPEPAKGVRTFEQSLSDFRKQATARGYNLVPNKKNN